MFGEYEIRELPLSLKPIRQKVESFLADNALRLEDVDVYAAVFANGGEEILAGGGLCGNTIKCVAVDETLRGTGMGAKLISHLVCLASTKGCSSIKVFTKPDNVSIFSSLGFQTLATAPQAIFMENGGHINDYCKDLKRLYDIIEKEAIPTDGNNTDLKNDCKSSVSSCHTKKRGIIVMNANPFTRGHRYLVEQAAKEVAHLFVMVVREDKSLFAYEERKAMVTAGCTDLQNVTVCDGSRYVISSDTFPTYFLKRIDDATDTQIQLDLNLFADHIAPALNISVRFVGSEPTDSLTRRYNQLMHKILPTKGIEVREIERLQMDHTKYEHSTENTDSVVSASKLRKNLSERKFLTAADIAYPTTIPYIIAELAEKAIHDELETTPKPGLVDCKDNGAHYDMDFPLMDKSIKALRPYFICLAQSGFQTDLPSYDEIRRIGVKAETAMFHTTHGVNTYKGALFAIGLTIVSAAHVYYKKKVIDIELLRHNISTLARQFPKTKGTHGEIVASRYHVTGAREHACEAFPQLFAQWLPFFGNCATNPYRFHKTLLFIMSSLNDTNVFYRGGEKAVKETKERSGILLKNFTLDGLEAMNRWMIQENISPGGSADMLSLTAFIHSLQY